MKKYLRSKSLIACNEMSNDANRRKSVYLELIIRSTFQCEISNDQYTE